MLQPNLQSPKHSINLEQEQEKEEQLIETFENVEVSIKDMAEDLNMKKSNSYTDLRSSLMMKELEENQVDEMKTLRYEREIGGVTVSAQGAFLIYISSIDEP